MGIDGTTGRWTATGAALAWLACLWLACLGWAGPAWGQANPSAEQAQLALIDAYYREGEAFRAESELLRFLNDYPAHPSSGDVELLRAKLYYLDGRYSESSLMLFSHLDRRPRHPTTRAAARLLTLSLVREGRLDDARPYLGAFREPGVPPPSLDPLRGPAPEAVDPDSAVLWSTFLPGSGFFALGEPGKAFAGLGLNLFFTAAAVISFEEDLPLAGLVFLLAELALYRGGREAVREAAEAQNTAREKRRRRAWTERHGERQLLGVGLRLRFGGG